MNALRTTSDVAAAAVAWHNRHPLARRIVSDQVHDIGVVDLPMAVPTPPARGGAQMLFAAQALFAASPARLTRWLRRHGLAPAQAPEGWPRRPLDAEPALISQAEKQGLTGRHTATVLCAAIDVDGKRLRLLLRPDGRRAVFGSRALSTLRVGAATLATALFSAALTFQVVSGTPDSLPAALAQGGPVVAEPVAQVASAAPSVSAETEAPQTTAAVLPASAATPTTRVPPGPQAIEQASAHTSPPVAEMAVSAQDAQAAAPPAATTASAARPRIRLALDDDARAAARAQSRALRADVAASAPASASPPTAKRLLQGPVYAIVTTATPHRETAQSQLALMRGLLSQTATGTPTRLDLMPVGRQWRVAWWPHPSKEAASKLLEQVGARGLRAEVLAF